MEQSAYGLSITLPVAFETAVEQISAALKAEGFGVLTTIDVQQTLKTKLDRGFRKSQRWIVWRIESVKPRCAGLGCPATSQ